MPQQRQPIWAVRIASQDGISEITAYERCRCPIGAAPLALARYRGRVLGVCASAAPVFHGEGHLDPKTGLNIRA